MRAQHPQFSNVVSSHDSVREAFAEYGLMQRWWKVILRLHGKPVNISISETERITCVADGFRFYASLYRVLAVLFLGLALLFFFYGAAAEISSYGSAAAFCAGLYLWMASGLGYKAARNYRFNSSKARFALLGFMVMIVVFLASFAAAVSIVIEQQQSIAFVPNLGATVLLFVFGIGSYFIEILYLADNSIL